jgi:hypothetical protein
MRLPSPLLYYRHESQHGPSSLANNQHALFTLIGLSQ